MTLVSIALVTFGAAVTGIIAGVLIALWLVVWLISPPGKE